MASKKPTHGGKRKGAGRPATGSTLISFRVSNAQLGDLTTAGKRRGLTANLEAKARCFPDGEARRARR